MVMLNKESIEVIETILRHHNVCEVKLEKGRPVVVEITRQAKYKAELPEQQNLIPAKQG